MGVGHVRACALQQNGCTFPVFCSTKHGRWHPGRMQVGVSNHRNSRARRQNTGILKVNSATTAHIFIGTTVAMCLYASGQRREKSVLKFRPSAVPQVQRRHISRRGVRSPEAKVKRAYRLWAPPVVHVPWDFIAVALREPRNAITTDKRP